MVVDAAVASSVYELTMGSGGRPVDSRIIFSCGSYHGSCCGIAVAEVSSESVQIVFSRECYTSSLCQMSAQQDLVMERPRA